MSKNKKSDSANNYLAVLALGFIACSALLFFISVEENHPPVEGSAEFSSLSPRKENEIINKHLMKTTENMEYEKLKTQVENLKAARAFSEVAPQKPIYSGESDFFDFDGDPRLRQLAEDVGRANDAKKIKTNDPQNLVYESMFRDEQNQKRDYDQKVAKAKEFIRKAKQDGWAVVIDENFKIKSYRRIEKSQQQDESDEREARKFEGYELFPSK